MDRRRFLMGAGLLGLGLAGCQPAADALRVRALKGSVPPQLLQQFRAQHGANPAPDLVLATELDRQYKALQDWQRQAPIGSSWVPGWAPGWIPGAQAAQPIPDLVTLGDYWLSGAIRQGLLQPLEAQTWSHWAALNPIWKALATRNGEGMSDPQGQIWGAPYRWGATAIAYRRDILADRQLAPPTDWADLWVRPARSPQLNPLLNPWIDFWWDPDVATQMSTLSRSGSPAAADQFGSSDPGWLQRSEFLDPLSAKASASYQALWAKIRQ
jgi:putative spermidine/putrescine transport system substrate-binding protein